MSFTITFAASGALVLLLIVAKHIEVRRKKALILLSLISKGDSYVRSLSHTIARRYIESKDRMGFLFTKQLPLHSKSLLNKTGSYIRERMGRHLGNFRNSRLLRRSDGLSDFFKTISNIERGNGTINEPFEKPLE